MSPINSQSHQESGLYYEKTIKAACTGMIRSPIPELSDHPFRDYPITDSGIIRPN